MEGRIAIASWTSENLLSGYGQSATTEALGTSLILPDGHLLCVAALLDIHLPASGIRIPPVFDHGYAHRLRPGQVPKPAKIGVS
jgi:hypothetical protein